MTKQIIGSRIKIARINKNLTQMELCKLAEIDEISLDEYESGLDEPSLKEIKDIAIALSISTDYIIGRID